MYGSFPGVVVVKNPPANAEEAKDTSKVQSLGREDTLE